MRKVPLSTLSLSFAISSREKRPTDPIDELLMKIIEHGPRHLMVAEKGAAYGYSR